MIDPASVKSLVRKAVAGERGALARAITLVESGGAGCEAVLSCLPDFAADCFILGVTGAPGAGKSTLVGALLRHIRASGERVAVLAVDPSSPFTRGALLGDRLRMTAGARDDGVFIRSMASRGQHGGLATATQAVALLIGACGWPIIIIETVGIGQVEVDIAAAADRTAVVVNPGWGDEIQTSKAGLMEVGDVFVINKADRPGVADTRRDLVAQLARRGDDRPAATVLETVATSDHGTDALYEWLLQVRESASGDAATPTRATRIAEFLAVACRQRLDSKWRALRESDAFARACERIGAGDLDIYEAVDGLLGKERD